MGRTRGFWRSCWLRGMESRWQRRQRRMQRWGKLGRCKGVLGRSGWKVSLWMSGAGWKPCFAKTTG